MQKNTYFKNSFWKFQEYWFILHTQNNTKRRNYNNGTI